MSDAIGDSTVWGYFGGAEANTVTARRAEHEGRSPLDGLAPGLLKAAWEPPEGVYALLHCHGFRVNRRSHPLGKEHLNSLNSGIVGRNRFGWRIA